ncbi:hypothetical protein D2E26_0389 [Bifidobacterium dolichotidis]|uniref:Uncharacterized protein n=1 Tax=Bifidobacterium dolichotidis TaxID=2306976 RepID=A0A430FSG7_9BIFI|nr:hypothetical protein [Bifidobacterium dolichotidis]RSX55826.1 hypothetical protein D2E26_0389 [Bifidobacterium dolichotidis]
MCHTNNHQQTMTQDQGASSDGDKDFQNEATQQDEQQEQSQQGQQGQQSEQPQHCKQQHGNMHSEASVQNGVGGTAADDQADAQYLVDQHAGSEDAGVAENGDQSQQPMQQPNGDGTGVMSPEDPRGEGSLEAIANGTGAEQGSASEQSGPNTANGQHCMQHMNA